MSLANRHNNMMTRKWNDVFFKLWLFDVVQFRIFVTFVVYVTIGAKQ